MLIRVLLVFAAVAWPVSSVAQGFEVHLWPGEGRPVFEAEGEELTLQESPSISSAVVGRVRPTGGMPLEFLDTRYTTVRAGSITTLVHSQIVGRSFGDIATLSKAEYYSDRYSLVNISVAVGQTFDYLQDRAEGTCLVRIEGKVVEAESCPTLNPDEFEVKDKPEVEWWIRSSVEGVVGWLLIKDGVIREARRVY